MSPSRPSRLFRQDSERGSVILITLCFVAVLAIMLAGYIAVCNRAMQLSNRSFQAELSRQLAEAGIDEALRAFNKNDWSDWTSSGITSDWTLDAANKRARASVTFPATKFGQGATATVKLRVDNYDARVLSAAWSSSKTYKIGDQVGYNGDWYTCVRSHSNQTPSGLASLAYWVPEPMPWKWQPDTTYYNEDVINYDHDGDGAGTWFRCTSDHTSPATWTGANWTVINGIALYGTSYYSHSNGDIFYYPNSTTWYRWTANSPSTSYTTTPNISWDYTSSKTYRYNDLVCYGSTYIWYRYINTTPASGITPGTNASYWENALTGSMHGWSSSSINYSIGDVVYYSSTSDWYRCVQAHTSSGSLTPANTTYWANTPLHSRQWQAGPYYVANDVVTYNGIWYLCILSHTGSSTNLPTNTSYWIPADTANTAYQWNSTTSYAVNVYRCYGGVWYKSLSANTGKSPNNTTYWSPSWAQSSGVTTGAPVVYAEATVTLGDGTTSRTQLRAPIAISPLHPNAAAATTSLIIVGGSGTVDSYDSVTDPGYASPGWSAVLAAGDTSGTALTIGNGTTVKGYAAAPSDTSTPYAPLISFGSSATVKSATSPVSPNVDLSRVSRSPSIPQLDPLPQPSLSSAFSSNNFPTGLQLSSSYGSTFELGTPGSVVPSRYYFGSSLDLGTNSGYDMTMLNINGPVILYVDGNFRTRTNGGITINSAGSLELHIDGYLRTYFGSPGFQNTTLDPKKLTIIADSTSSSTTYFKATPNPLPFYGTVYMPNTTYSTGFDIQSGVEIYGAVSARKIQFSSEATLHYDTTLRSTIIPGVDQPYTVTQWRELDATNAATMP